MDFSQEQKQRDKLKLFNMTKSILRKQKQMELTRIEDLKKPLDYIWNKCDIICNKNEDTITLLGKWDIKKCLLNPHVCPRFTKGYWQIPLMYNVNLFENIGLCDTKSVTYVTVTSKTHRFCSDIIEDVGTVKLCFGYHVLKLFVECKKTSDHLNNICIEKFDKNIFSAQKREQMLNHQDEHIVKLYHSFSRLFDMETRLRKNCIIHFHALPSVGRFARLKMCFENCVFNSTSIRYQ